MVEEVSENLLASDGKSGVALVEHKEFLVVFVMFRVVENTSEVRVDCVSLFVYYHLKSLTFQVTKCVSFT